MDKESLEYIEEKLIEIINQSNINIIDKVELTINITSFLEEYEENIKILQRR